MKIWIGLIIAGIVLFFIGFLIGDFSVIFPIIFFGVVLFGLGAAIGFERFIRRAKYE